MLNFFLFHPSKHKNRMIGSLKKASKNLWHHYHRVSFSSPYRPFLADVTVSSILSRRKLWNFFTWLHHHLARISCLSVGSRFFLKFCIQQLTMELDETWLANLNIGLGRNLQRMFKTSSSSTDASPLAWNKFSVASDEDWSMKNFSIPVFIHYFYIQSLKELNSTPLSIYSVILTHIRNRRFTDKNLQGHETDEVESDVKSLTQPTTNSCKTEDSNKRKNKNRIDGNSLRRP